MEHAQIGVQEGQIKVWVHLRWYSLKFRVQGDVGQTTIKEGGIRVSYAGVRKEYAILTVEMDVFCGREVNSELLRVPKLILRIGVSVSGLLLGLYGLFCVIQGFQEI